MPYAAVAEKLKMIPEQYLDEVSQFFDFIMYREREGYVPNSELAAAIKESEQMLSDPNAKKFNSVDALFEDLDSED